MSEKLLPCPFCGGEAVIERISGSYGYYPAKLRVACLNSTFDKGSKCGCRGVFFGHGEHGYDKTSVAEAKAIAAWNTRAAMQVDAAPVAEIVAWLRNRKEMTERYIDYIEAAQAADAIEAREWK